MEVFIDWIITNKQWLFSGVGVLVIAGVVRLIFNKACVSSTQIIRSGNNSTNVQAGRDVSIGTNKKGNDVEQE